MPQRDSRPNVLFIMLDDLNEWIGCLGANPDVRTPNMDRLAEEGMLFTNACCTSPVCNPSRTSALTGMRPTTTGCYLLNDQLIDSPERFNAVSFPLHMRRNGYRTLLGGKVEHWGNPVQTASLGTFNEDPWCENAGVFGGQQMDLHSRRGGSLEGMPSFYGWAFHWGPLDEDQAQTQSDRLVADWAVGQLQRDHEDPFLLAVGIHRPHTPLTAPQRFFDMYPKEDLWLPPTGPVDMEGMPDAARQVALTGYQDPLGGMHKQIMDQGIRREITQAYLASISFADHCVGRVLSALERSPYADNTMVVLASDNGWALGEHFHWKKWSVFDSGARVPFIVKVPGVTDEQAPCAQGVDLADIYPTIVDFCDLPDPGQLDGQSLRGLLSGREHRRERPALTSYGPNNHSLRTDRWRYTRYCDGSEELYDYRNDPHEHNNLADSPDHASVKTDLARWLPADCAEAVSSVPRPGATLEPRPGEEIWFRGIEEGFAGCRVTIIARVRAQGDGLVLHNTGYFTAYSLYVKDGRPCMGVQNVETPLRWDTLDPQRTIVEAEEPLPDRLVEVRGIWDTDGRITLRVDGRLVAEGRTDGPMSIYPGGLIETGQYVQIKYPAIGDYEKSHDFPGELRDIRVEFAK